MSAIVDAIICVPFGTVLRYIYNFVGSYGWAIILFTILTKIILMPLTIKQKRSMLQMQRVQPKLKALEKQYAATNRAKYQEEVTKLYQQEGVSPMGGCLPMLIQLPIMIGLYYVINRPLTFFMGLNSEEIIALANRLNVIIPESAQQFQMMEISMASQVHARFAELSSISPKLLSVDFNFLGLNLGATPQWSQISLLWLIPLLSGATAFLLNRITMRTQAQGGTEMPGQAKSMMLMMPLMSVWIGFVMPTGVGLYWITSNVMGLIQEISLTRYFEAEADKRAAIMEKEEAIREAARKEIERQNALENQKIQLEQQTKKSKGGKK